MTWRNADTANSTQQEAKWLLQQPTIDAQSGAAPAPGHGGRRYEATFTRPYIAHASIAPSCALALFAEGRLTVWSHTQGVFPLRNALARNLGLDPTVITVRTSS